MCLVIFFLEKKWNQLTFVSVPVLTVGGSTVCIKCQLLRQ